VLTEEEAEVACIHYDINEVGEMHHNPAKNVLYIRAWVEEIAVRLKLTNERVVELLASAKAKMYASRLQRPTPYVDKTIYTGWNALCISAYLEAAKVLGLDQAKSFALRSLDRILTQVWDEKGLRHVVAYSDPEAQARDVAGVLDDYAFTANACLDAYEATADLRYFTIGRELGDALVKQFFDPVGGGFFDTETNTDDASALGVLATRRKPFQDSPTPAGNSMAALVLLRLHSYTNEASYRDKAGQTLDVIAGMAAQFGIFAATYGIAAVHLAYPHTQIVIIGEGDSAQALRNAALSRFALNQSVLALGSITAEQLPPALQETLPGVPGILDGKAKAVVCTNFSCYPPVSDAMELRKILSGAN
jgi:uncharacterized protein YyaL (SSP411 family)